MKWTTNDASAGKNPVFNGVTLTDFSDSMGSTDAENAANFLYTNAELSEDGKVRFSGTYDPVTLTAGDKGSLFLGSDNKLYYPSADRTINTFRGYFHVDLSQAPVGVRAFVLNFGEEDDETGINILTPDPSHNGDEKAGTWYSLDGRKLNGKPTAKGVYINNGKKRVIK